MPSIPYDANEKKKKKEVQNPEKGQTALPSPMTERTICRVEKKTEYDKRNSNQRMMMSSPHPSRVIPA